MKMITLSRHALAALLVLSAPLAWAGPNFMVTVENNKVVLKQAPKRSSSADNATTWVLRTPGFVFAQTPVVFSDANAPVDCQVSQDGRTARCVPQGRAALGDLSYRVQLVSDGTAAAQGELSSEPDVWTMND